MIDLAGIDQVLALAPANIDTIELATIERESRNGQRLSLHTGYLEPVTAAAGWIPAITHLGDDALETNLAGLLVHLAAVDLEAFAKLDRGLGDQLLQMRFAIDQRQFLKIVAIKVEQVESHHHDLGRLTLQLVL